MGDAEVSGDLLGLLNEATAREMRVSMQYMLQHTLYSGRGSAVESDELGSKAGKFVASHSPVFLPGKTLKKVAITEMRHAEAVAERISSLGAEPTTEAGPFSIGKNLREILELDKAAEEGAIKLYNQIVRLAGDEGDQETKRLFVRVLSDEEKHLRTFAELLQTL
jgi:bacterioferritin